MSKLSINVGSEREQGFSSTHLCSQLDITALDLYQLSQSCVGLILKYQFQEIQSRKENALFKMVLAL